MQRDAGVERPAARGRRGRDDGRIVLVDVAKLVSAYYTGSPDPAVASQAVAFGTSGHRGSSLHTAFNEAHLLAIAQAVVEWLTQGRFSTLNIAGPREEKRPGIYKLVMSVLDNCLKPDDSAQPGLVSGEFQPTQYRGLRIAPSAFEQRVTDIPESWGRLNWD